MTAQDTAKRGQVSDTQGQVSEMKTTAETTPSGSAVPEGAMPTGAVPDGVSPGGVIMEADLQAHIGRQLRAVYDEVVNEAVPDRFLRLLEELEHKKAEDA